MESSAHHKLEPSEDSAPKPPDEPISPGASTVAAYLVSPRRVAVFSTVIATAALAALAVVAAVKNVDELATIALVLAILAFVIQILVFVVQTQAANEQRVRSEQLNTQTRALLAEVSTTAASTQAMVGQQFNQLLQAFVTGASETAQEAKFDPATFEQRLLSNIRSSFRPPEPGSAEAVAATRAARQPTQPPQVPSRTRERAAQRARERALRQQQVNALRSFPSEEEGQSAVTTLRELTPEQRYRLQELGEDEINTYESGAYVGLDPEPGDTELEERNLVTKTRVDVGGGELRVVNRLTSTGREAARLLTGTGEIPSWAREVIDVRRPADRTADDDLPF